MKGKKAGSRQLAMNKKGPFQNETSLLDATSCYLNWMLRLLNILGL